MYGSKVFRKSFWYARSCGEEKEVDATVSDATLCVRFSGGGWRAVVAKNPKREEQKRKEDGLGPKERALSQFLVGFSLLFPRFFSRCLILAQKRLWVDEARPVKG